MKEPYYVLIAEEPSEVHQIKIIYNDSISHYLYGIDISELKNYKKKQKTIHILDGKTNERVATLESFRYNNFFSIISDRNFLYTSEEQEGIRIWDKNKWTLVNGLIVDNEKKDISNRFKQIMVDDKYIYASYNRKLVIWSLDSWEEIIRLNMGDWEGYNFFIDPASSGHIITASGKLLRIWEKNSWKLFREYEEQLDNIYALALDENYIYTSSLGASTKITRLSRKNNEKQEILLEEIKRVAFQLEVPIIF